MKLKYINYVKNSPLWLVFFLCLVIFCISVPDFFSIKNLMNILMQASIFGFIAIGMTLLIISGNFDLSVGSTMALSGALFIGLQSYNNIFALLVAFFVSILIGLINGFFVVKVGVDALVMTLASMIGIRGLVFVYTEEKSIAGQAKIFETISNFHIGYLPVLGIIFILLVILFEFILKYTVHCRNCYAIGGNYKAAKLSGINVNKHIIINFAITALFAGLAGIALTSRINSSTPILGTGYELLVITMVVLGGTKLSGGYGNMIGTFGAVLLIQMIQNAMNLLGVHSFINLLVTGLMLIIVIILDRIKEVRSQI
jgi:ribose transport system permease protein